MTIDLSDIYHGLRLQLLAYLDAALRHAGQLLGNTGENGGRREAGPDDPGRARARAGGAGKTTVLVELVISLVTDPDNPVDVDRLLVVTFTNAAAAEMRERIGRALAQEAARRPGARRLHRQMALLGRACISTMHSFCLDLLREYFYRLELDPAFRVADETEAALLQMEALEELFERRYAAKDNLLFTALVDCYGGRRDDTLLQELVLDAFTHAK